MNEEEKLPFFLNTRRLQRADSYFDIGRTQEKLRRLLNEKNNSDSEPISCNDLEEHASVGFYGIKRYISLEPDPGDKDLLQDDFVEIDEDVQFENTSAFSLFWMTFKRIALSLGEHFSTPKLPRGALDDLECNNKIEEVEPSQLYKVLVDPSFRDPRIKQSKIVYGDVNYLIQKFRMDLNCGSLDIALFSVEFPGSQAQKFDPTDLQAYVVSPDCGSYTWIENGKASAIFMTKSSPDFFGSVIEWFRKILSDMALADSVMIGHPYYWHATVRRRLTKVMKYLKRLYRTLALKEKERCTATQPERINPDKIEVICPSEVSKIVINEQPSENLQHSCCTYEKLNIMLEQLVKKWFEYQRNLKKSFGGSINDISRTWSESSPQSLNRPFTDEGGNFLESVTFLDFFPEKREIKNDLKIPAVCTSSDVPNDEKCKDNNNNDKTPIKEPFSYSSKEMSCVRINSEENNTTENFAITESSHRPPVDKFGKEEQACEVLHCSTKVASETSIEIEQSERSVASTTFPLREDSMTQN